MKTKIEIFYARKIWNGKVSVQSSVVEFCKRLDRKLIVDFQGQRMLIQNLNDYTCDGQSFLAHHSDKYMKAGQMYKLWDYTWVPVEQKPEEPEITLEGRMKMLAAWKELQKKKQKQLTI